MTRKLRFSAASAPAFSPTTTPADHLELISQLYQLDGDKRRATAFRNAATAVSGHGKLTVRDAMALPGVGKGSATAVDQFVRTGTSDRLEELATRWPAREIQDLCRVKGVGPMKAMSFFNEGLKSLADLTAAVERGDITNGLSDEIRRAGELSSGRIERERIEPIAQAVVEALKSVRGRGLKVEVCGSYRRGRQTLKDLDIVACAPVGMHAKLHKKLIEVGKHTRSSGDVRSAVLVERYGTTVQVDLWTVLPESWGSALNHATGSKAHNVWRRTRLSKMGIRENEFGLWRGKQRVGGLHEEDAYTLMGVPFVKPKDREEGR